MAATPYGFAAKALGSEGLRDFRKVAADQEADAFKCRWRRFAGLSHTQNRESATLHPKGRLFCHCRTEVLFVDCFEAWILFY